MRKGKKILLFVLSALCALSMTFAVACATTVNPVSQKVIYHVGTNIDLFELFETEDGFIYTFEVGKKGAKDTKPVMGRYYYAESSGEFTAHLKGVKGKTTQKGSADFTVSDTLPFMVISGSSVKMNYNSFIDIDRLINNVNIFMSSDTDVEYAIDKVVFYKNHYVSEGQEIAIQKGTPSGDGFYDGNNKLTFNKEGVYDFNLIATNAGGTVGGTFRVSVAENINSYLKLGEPDFNDSTNIVSWNAIEGASYYRVKIDYENVITDKNSIDINDYLIEEANGFQDFDLVVIPLDANKKELKYKDGLYNVTGMLIKEDVIIAPESFGNIVLGESTKVNPETGVATLMGGSANKDLSYNGLSAMDSGYLGWKGNYGLNTYVEFEFTGNNIPNVIFFADEINNQFTYGGQSEVSEKNKGLMVVSGIYGAYSPAVNTLVCGDTVAIFGPFRYEHGWSNQYNRWMKTSSTSTGRHPEYVGGFGNSIPEEYALLTQNGLISDTTGRTYKYVVGTYGVQSGEATKIYLEMRMYDVANLEEPLFVVQQDTKLTTDDFKFGGDTFNGGNVIVLAPSKEESVLSEIKVSKPFESQPLNILKSGVTVNSDGSYTIKGSYPNNANSATFTSAQVAAGSLAGFRAYTGVNEAGYGLGTYLDITFKGNNLPVLTFFADDTSGGIAEGVVKGTGAGIIMLNGIVNKTPTSPANTDKLRIIGPYKYGAKNADKTEYIYNNSRAVFADYTVSSNDSGYSTLKNLSQDALDANIDYRLIVGAVEKDGYIALDIQFVNVTENKLLVESVAKTKVTVSAMKDALGLAQSAELKGFIVASGAFKGADEAGTVLDTTCKITLTDTRPSSGLVFVRYPENVTLDGCFAANANAGNFKGQAVNQISKHYTLLNNEENPAEYGLNTYIDLTFMGNNMPIITFFAKEDSGAIANGYNTATYTTGQTGAGIILINGIQNNATTNARTDEFRITGPYKYGAKLVGAENSIYDHNANATYVTSSAQDGNADLANLAQDNLVADNEYRLIIGVVDVDGIINFDICLKNVTTSTVIVNRTVASKVSVTVMKTALGITDGDLTGHIILNGAYKGKDAEDNALPTVFTLNAVQAGKISMPA